MKIQYLSDLHIESGEMSVEPNESDVVVLAGDIHVKDNGINWVIKNFRDKPVIYVMGNHEFYGKAYPKHVNTIKKLAVGTNVHVLENDIITINGVNFLGCTLWTDFNLFGNPASAGYQCQQAMSDYKQIRLSPKYSRIKPVDVTSIHRRSLTWLGEELQRLRNEKNIVITHHAPTVESLPHDYSNDPLSPAYASNLNDFIKRHQPNYWIHGHLHYSLKYQIGNCQILCNPRGYSSEPNEAFDQSRFIVM